MAYKLIDAAGTVVGGQCTTLVALVSAGAVFHKGKLLERPTDIAAFGAGRPNLQLLDR